VKVTVKKLRKPAIYLQTPVIVYKIAPSGNSDLAGRKIVGVASVAKFSRGFVLSQSTFHLVNHKLQVYACSRIVGCTYVA